MLLLREAVSKEKRRYKEDGFDLDLSYMGINNRIVAMGFPSESMEAAYRNPMKEVIRLFDSKHKDHYKVYNLCSEREYDAEKFHNRVERYPFDDHNAPPFEKIKEFCVDVQEWLDQNEENIAVIHCKAGKGRTGLMICAWLLFSGMWPNPDDALSYYASMRTHNQKGVTIPSQLRYVRYFHESLGITTPYAPRTLLLTQVVFHTLPKSGSLSDVDFTISVGKAPVFNYRQYVDTNKLRDVPKVHRLEGKKKKKGKKKERKDLAEQSNGQASGSEGEQNTNSNNNNNHNNGSINGEDNENNNNNNNHQNVLEETAVFDCGTNGIPLIGDVKMEFERKGEKMFAFWFNTFFVKDLHVIIDKIGLDKAHKDCKSHKLYQEGFKVELIFDEMSTSSSARLTTVSSSPSISNMGVSPSSPSHKAGAGLVSSSSV